MLFSCFRYQSGVCSVIASCCFSSFQQGVEGEIPYVTSDYNYSILGSGKLKKKKHFKKREYAFECDYT